MWRHPNYYKELRKRAREEKEASSSKQQAIDETVPHCDIEEATSDKQEGTSNDKEQASSNTNQEAS
jgi:hypothetical protein